VSAAACNLRGRRWLALALLALAFPLSAQAQQHPSNERGMHPEKAYQFDDFDAINMLNGNVTLTIPVGQRFPVSERFSYGLTLIYNSKAWDFQEATFQGQIYNQAVPDRLANAGMGWRLSLGQLFGPDSPINDHQAVWLYFGADGAEHVFYNSPHPTGNVGTEGCTNQNTCYTHDSSYLRLRVVDPAIPGGDPVKEIDFPDGTTHVFTRFVVGAQYEWRLTAMRDRFIGGIVPGLPDVTVSYSFDSNTWTIGDRFGRTQTVIFETISGDRYKRRVKEVRLAAVGGTTATYTFNYVSPLATIRVPCGNTLPNWSNVKASQLSSVTLPDGTLAFTYYAADDVPNSTCYGYGLIRRVTLPTGGKVNYTYRERTLPITGCSTRDWLKNSAAVYQRSFLDRTNATLGTWTYTASLSSPPPHPPASCNDHPGAYSPPPEELKVTLQTPLGDKENHFFSVWPGDDLDQTSTSFQVTDYGLPFTRLSSDGDGRFKSTEFFDCDANGANCGSPRTSYVRYERDTQGGCGALGLTSECTNVNRRLAAAKTVYEDGKWASSDSSDFDGFGHYRRETLNGNFGRGDSSVVDTAYNANVTATVWILDIVDAVTTTVGGAQAKREQCVDRATGFVKRMRLLKQSSGARHADDVLVVYTPNSEGNVEREEYYGGDGGGLSTTAAVCDVSPGTSDYRIDHGYSFGVRDSSFYVNGSGTPLSFYTLKQSIDFSTGLATSSESEAGPPSGGNPAIAGLVTSYEYDSSGRLTWAKPAAGHGAWVNYRYTTDEDTGRRTVKVEHHLNGDQTTNGVIAEENSVVDDLGRLWLHRQRMPDGTWSEQQMLYNGMGWKASVSEVAAKGAANVAVTQHTDYDPYGRPRKIIHPDLGETTFVYTGVSRTSRTERVGTTYNAGTQQVTNSDAVTDEAFDRLGRLWSVTERSGAGDGPVTTVYTYDVGGRLSDVCHKPDLTLIEANCTQERRFIYDNRGFLTAERHPEKGTNGAGTDGWVTYRNFDARGHAGERLDGTDANHDLLFDYDRGERLLRIRETGTFSSCDAAGPRCLKEFTYGTDNGNGEWRNGKVATAARYNYATLGTIAYKIKVRETYVYQGRDGRPSERWTQMYLNGATAEGFRQWFRYDDLGDLVGLDYPNCTNCPGLLWRTITPTFSRGFMTAIPGYASSITYHPNGMVFKVTHANQLVDVQEISSNSIARPRQLLSKQGSFVRWDSGLYNYDPAGDVVKTGDSWYTYDRVQRMKQASVVDGAKGDGARHNQLYEFDAYGNLNKVTTDATVRPIPTSVATNRLNEGSSYDPAGNLTCWQNGGSSCSATFQYDGLNMVSRMLSGAEDWIYVYTADDERFLSYRVGTVPLRFWALRGLDGKVLREAETDANGILRVRRDYVYRGDGGLVASESDGHDSSFVDTVGHWAAAEIEALYLAGITAGCSPQPGGSFCPDLVMTRDQMAVFLIKASSPPGYQPPPCVTPEFNDVPCSNNFAPWINELKRRGITAGCGNNNYCPLANVSKGQMAVFTLTAQGITPPPCQGNIFNDFTCASPPYYYARHAEEVYRRGIDLGCGNNNFCPEEVVTRAKAAVWLKRAFNLPVPDRGFARHYHLDHLLSPRLITSTAASPLGYHLYYPFGEEVTSSLQDAEKLKFTGHERDLNAQSGGNPAGDDLDYMHARYYKPLLGRFLSVDPLMSGVLDEPQSFNLYSYVRGNPLNYVDPDGRWMGAFDWMRALNGAYAESITVTTRSVLDDFLSSRFFTSLVFSAYEYKARFVAANARVSEQLEQEMARKERCRNSHEPECWVLSSAPPGFNAGNIKKLSTKQLKDLGLEGRAAEEFKADYVGSEAAKFNIAADTAGDIYLQGVVKGTQIIVPTGRNIYNFWGIW
jgi:RHS repeat-associated protein